jgi:hypothetical protein
VIVVFKLRVVAQSPVLQTETVDPLADTNISVLFVQVSLLRIYPQEYYPGVLIFRKPTPQVPDPIEFHI